MLILIAGGRSLNLKKKSFGDEKTVIIFVALINNAFTFLYNIY